MRQTWTGSLMQQRAASPGLKVQERHPLWNTWSLRQHNAARPVWKNQSDGDKMI